MTSTHGGPGRLICGTGGALLIVSLFLPWSSAGDIERSGWEIWSMSDVLLITGLVAIAAALTGGRIGVFRRDVSLIGAADLLGVLATLLLGWWILFDFPEPASRGIGVYLALISAIAVAGGAGDYGTFRGEPLFPRLGGDEGRRAA